MRIIFQKNNSENKMFRQNLGLIRKLSLSQFRTSNLLITDSAASRLKEICSPAEYLRVSVGGGGCSGYSYEFDLSDEPIDPDMDLVFTKDGSRVVTDKESIELMDGSTIDFKQELIKKSFVVSSNPLSESGCSCGASFSIEL